MDRFLLHSWQRRARDIGWSRLASILMARFAVQEHKELPRMTMLVTFR